MATTTCSETKSKPLTCLIETDTTTIEVVTTEALIDQHDNDQDDQFIGMATNSASSCVDVKIKAEFTKEEHRKVTDDDVDDVAPTMYASVLEAAAAMDAEDLLKAVGLKILNSYSLWDLMLTKARGPNVDGVLPLLITDTERVLLELKILLESTMEFVPPRVGRKKKNLDAKELYVTELLGAALCVDPGLWRMKSVDDIHYDSPMLEIHRLLSKENPTPSSSVILGSANVITGASDPLPAVASIGVRKRDTTICNKNWECSAMNVKAERDMNKEIGEKTKNDPGYAVSSSGRRIKRRGDFHFSKAGGSGEDQGLRRRGRPRKTKPAAGDSCSGNDKPTSGAICKRGIQGNEENDPKSRPKVKKARLKYKMVENKFACQYSDCTKSEIRYNNRSEFEQHFLDDHATDEHKFIPCLIGNCGEMFALTSQRNVHMDENHERLFGCRLCDRKFFRELDVVEHVKRSHPVSMKETLMTEPISYFRANNEYFDPACVCSRCGKKFASKAYVDNHERSCDGMFVRQPKFTQSKINGLWFCQEKGCSTKVPFDCEYALRMHFYDTHLREEEKIFVCEYCNQHFALRTLLNKHVDAAHLKRFQCDWCGRRFGGKDKLKTHTYTHTGEKPYACDKCDYRTAKKYNLDSHKQSKHQDFQAKSHYCELCGKGFCTQGRVRQHKKVIHKEGRVETLVDRRKKAAHNVTKKIPGATVMAGPAQVMQELAATATASSSEIVTKQGEMKAQQIAITTVRHPEYHVGGGEAVVQHVSVTGEQDVEYITTELSDQAGIVVGLRY